MIIAPLAVALLLVAPTLEHRFDPEIAIAVIIDDADARCPSGVAYGAKVAAPIFKRLGERLIPYRDIRPTISNDAVPAFALGGGGR